MENPLSQKFPMAAARHSTASASEIGNEKDYATLSNPLACAEPHGKDGGSCSTLLSPKFTLPFLLLPSPSGAAVISEPGVSAQSAAFNRAFASPTCTQFSGVYGDF